jgi:prepilin-type N-terminal cleavage/methylation domain-containing protein
MTTQRKRGFTLIELLVVIAIIGVLFAVAMPVFENAGRKDTERAAFQVMSTLRLARQHAISKRQWTLVVFPNKDGGDYTGAGGNTLDKCLRSYAVLAATSTLDGEYRFDPALRDPRVSDMKLAFVSDWKFLPEGIYFDDDVNQDDNFLFGGLVGGQPAYEAVFTFPTDPANPNVLVRPMGAILFKPNGRAHTMYDGSATGKYWRDQELYPNLYSIYVTSAKYYEKAGSALSAPQTIPGTNTVLQVRNKTGQVQLLK